MKGFKNQLPLAPLTQILQQRAGEQAGQGLGLGHLMSAVPGGKINSSMPTAALQVAFQNYKKKL